MDGARPAMLAPDRPHAAIDRACAVMAAALTGLAERGLYLTLDRRSRLYAPRLVADLPAAAGLTVADLAIGLGLLWSWGLVVEVERTDGRGRLRKVLQAVAVVVDPLGDGAPLALRAPPVRAADGAP